MDGPVPIGPSPWLCVRFQITSLRNMVDPKTSSSITFK